MVQDSSVELTTEEVVRTLLRTFGLVKRALGPHFARFGISNSQWSVLRTLHRAKSEGKTKLRLRDLGERLLIRPPSVTRVIENLVKKGLVTEQTSASDSRAKDIQLSAGGTELVESILVLNEKKMAEVLGILEPPQQAGLKDSLDKICTHLESIVGK
jgi:DNA-binding MarR family transcriptional regulator